MSLHIYNFSFYGPYLLFKRILTLFSSNNHRIIDQLIFQIGSCQNMIQYFLKIQIRVIQIQMIQITYIIMIIKKSHFRLAFNLFNDLCKGHIFHFQGDIFLRISFRSHLKSL